MIVRELYELLGFMVDQGFENYVVIAETEGGHAFNCFDEGFRVEQKRWDAPHIIFNE